MNARINTFKKSFRELLADAGKKRVSKKDVPRHFRRLDSIARLLEGGSICAAVYYHHPTNTIWIANNKIHETSRDDNQEIKRIREIFQLIGQHGSSIEKIIECLTDVTYWHISQEKRYEKAKLDNADIKNKISTWMRELLQSGETTKDWRKRMLEEDETDDKNISFVLKKTARIIRDFIKVRSFLLENRNSAAANGILSAINNNKFEIVHMEGKNVHAEMRLLAKKIAANDEVNNAPYFGISKLCCNHCALAMKSFNIQTRGLHGQGANWVLPSFIDKSTAHQKTFFGKNTHTLWKALSEEAQKNARAYLESKESSPSKGNAKTGRDMYADSSSSDLEFGLQLSTDTQEEEINNFTLQKTWELKEIKQLYRKQYDWLSEIGLSITEIVALYANHRKFIELTSKGVQQFISSCMEYPFCDSSEKNIFEELSGYYTASEALYRKLISTPEHLISHYGFNDLVRALNPLPPVDSSSTSTSNENASSELTASEYFYSDEESSDPHAALQEAYDDEHGWDYDENSDDSQNRWTYLNSDSESDGYDYARSEEEESDNYYPYRFVSA